MNASPNTLEQAMAGLYDESMSNEELTAMSNRLVDFVGLLVEIRNDAKEGFKSP